MFKLIYSFVQFVQPLLVPVCFCLGWVLVLGTIWTLYSLMAELYKKAKQMHQIPCANCRFFTNDYRLKCTVNPLIANTERAIYCSDYRNRTNCYSIKT
jgi:hypothetical protein